MHRQQSLLFGTSTPILQLLEDAERFARLRDPILLLGERGTGKTVLARYIHKLSGRAGEFVEESAGRVPGGMESAWLEGHSKGAYTGAHTDGKGLFEAAHRGTFFLDELAMISSGLQVVLLHLLEGGVVRRMREIRPRAVDVRVIAATNADLDGEVAEGRFRRDLRDRFGYMVLRVPPLADRPDEIIPLADRFLDDFAREMHLPQRQALAPEVRSWFEIAPWNGNIRELQLVCRYAAGHAGSRSTIEFGDLPPEFANKLGDLGRRRHHTKADDLREQLMAAMEKSGGNRAKAARIMGISRTHFYRLASAVGLQIVLEMCNLASDRLHFHL